MDRPTGLMDSHLQDGISRIQEGLGSRGLGLVSRYTGRGSVGGAVGVLGRVRTGVSYRQDKRKERCIKPGVNRRPRVKTRIAPRTFQTKMNAGRDSYNEKNWNTTRIGFAGWLHPAVLCKCDHHSPPDSTEIRDHVVSTYESGLA